MKNVINFKKSFLIGLISLSFLQIVSAKTKILGFNSQLNIYKLVLPKEKIIGVLFYDMNVDYENVLSNCEQWGVNWIFTSSDVYLNQNFQAAVHKHKIKVAVIFSVFFHKDFLEAHPDDYAITSKGRKAINNWLHFACPSREDYLAMRRNELREVLKMNTADMIVLDFIRFYVFWENVFPDTLYDDIEDGCYCDKCLARFEKFSGLKLDSRGADWIKQHARVEWANWKCTVVEETVKDLTGIIKQQKPLLPIAIKTVPWKSRDFDGAIRSIAGQDISRLSTYADFFIPMTFSSIVHREPTWTNEVVNEVYSVGGKPVLPTSISNKIYSENEVTDNDFKDMLNSALKSPSSGVVIFFYNFLDSNPTKRDVLKAATNN